LLHSLPTKNVHKERNSVQEPHGVTTQKTPFFKEIAVAISATYFARIILCGVEEAHVQNCGQKSLNIMPKIPRSITLPNARSSQEKD
jgi:hypothetical protein